MKGGRKCSLPLTAFSAYALELVNAGVGQMRCAFCSGLAVALLVSITGAARTDFIPLGRPSWRRLYQRGHQCLGGRLSRGWVQQFGSVVVGFDTTALGQEAFVWDMGQGMRRLKDVLIAQGDDLAGWTLTWAEAVSADGRTIVGYGTNPSGQLEAWVARINVIPEPGSLSLFALGALGLFGGCVSQTGASQSRVSVTDHEERPSCGR